jgi:hypothetical protein
VTSAFGYGGTGPTKFPSGSGHESGYQWAAGKGITEESELPQREGSFREGAAAYLADLKAKADAGGKDADA